MLILDLAIPDDEIGWARSRVAAGLARRDRAEAEEAAWLQDAIDRGFSSGVVERTSARMFSDIRTKYLRQNG